MSQSRTVERLFGCGAHLGRLIPTHFSALNPEKPSEGWRTFLNARAQIVYFNFEEIISRAHGNFQEQKVLESSIIIINYCIITINAYYN
jgi:hypothetical protein